MSAISIVRTGAILPATLFLAVTVTVAQEGQIKHTQAPETPATSGQAMYGAYCAVCHGTDGKGGGPAASALKGEIPDLTTLAQRHGGKYPSEYVESVLRFGAENFPAHGNKEMPIWGPVFKSMPRGSESTEALRISNLTQYLGTLQVK